MCSTRHRENPQPGRAAQWVPDSLRYAPASGKTGFTSLSRRHRGTFRYQAARGEAQHHKQDHAHQKRPHVWRGIGEVITRHDDLTALTAGETARANHPALMKVYRLAARHDLPVLLHSNLTSLREETPIYLGELEDALRSNPDTRFVLAHAGTSGGVEKRQAPLATLNEIIRALLERYDNLYVDLSWSVREHYLIKDGEPRAAWVALIEDHPDRFVLGSDVVGHFDSIGAILGEYRPLLDALPKPVADKLRAENARALLPERGAVAED